MAAPVVADQSENAAVFEEAEKLSEQAHALADAGKTAEAIEAMERSVRLQEEKLVPHMPPEMQVLFRVELTEAKLFLVSQYLKGGDFTRGAAALEALVRFHEGVPANLDKYADRLDDWRGTLVQLKSNALLSRVREGMELHRAGRSSEALIVLQRVLPELDVATNIDLEQLYFANRIAATVLKSSLSYHEAEARYLRALAYAERAYGKEAPQLIDVLGELGQLGLARRSPELGAKHLVRAHAIAQASDRDALPGTVQNLGLLLMHRDDNAQAIVVFNRALALYAAQGGQAAALGTLATRLFLASTQDDAGRFTDAEASYVKLGSELDALLAREPSLLGLRAVYLRAYGVHYLRQANYGRAEQLLLEAAAVSAKLMPADSPGLLQQGCDLGETYWAAGDLTRSLDPIQRCFDSRESDVARVLATGTEEQKRAFLGSYLVAFQKTMNAQRLGGNGNVKLNRLALTQVLRTKGRVLDAMTSSGLAARSSQNQETRDLMQRLTSVRASMASLASSGTGSAESLKRLVEEASGIEARLSETNATFRSAIGSIDVPSVQQKLGADDVLLEIVQYRPLDAHYRKAAPELRYLAYVLHRDGEPQAVYLGPAQPIDTAVSGLRDVLRRPDRDIGQRARVLYGLVMKPVLAALAGKKHVFLAPDGALNAVPFAALMDGDGFLVERYDFTYLTSGRDLLRFNADSPASGPIVAFANPDFGSADGKVSGGGTKLSRITFGPLPGTQAEADALERLFPDAQVHTGSDASEAAVKQVSRPFALHLATHGYFLPAQSLSNLSGPDGKALDVASASARLAVAENPLVRSGLAFAGATGLHGGAGEDGVLTALEASSLDLTGTQLVVLSACQTAEGEVSQGEGVYGLRRALTVAGAEALVMSLWSVDDEATSYLMRGYYRRIKEGMGRSAALRDVQLVLARRAVTKHPYFWAAFIPSGNPSPIVIPTTVSGVASETPGTSRSSSDGASSASSNDDDDDEDFPIATPSFGMSLGGAQLSLTPAALGTRYQGYQGYVSADVSVVSAIWDEDLGNEQRGVTVYDRLGANLGAFTVSGSSLATLSWDYNLVVGYRARYIGLFAGARYGSGTVAVTDGPKNTGSIFPPAARLELPWFWDSRLSAIGYYGALLGRREAIGVDVRVPLGSETFWLQGGFSRTAGKPDQNNHAMVVPISLGFSED